ncbi:MAG: response regulator [Chromatiales bacterium]|nr:response regulator [Chromatiales bacterium]
MSASMYLSPAKIPSEAADPRAPFEPAAHTLLVVNSRAGPRRKLTRMLERAGFSTREFSSAEKLLAEIDEFGRSCCVITEQDLVGISGLDMLRALRSRHRQVPVIMLADQDDVALAVAALRSNVSDYLARPFAERDLVARVRNLLATAGL